MVRSTEMKTALGLLAALGCSCAAAQSSVTLFGIVDAGIGRGWGGVSNRTQMISSGNTPSRIGFRGVEDLGGGLSASFWLEAGLNIKDGTGSTSNTNNQLSGVIPAGGGLVFGRRSTVSLGGSFGELRFGRDYTPQLYSHILFDPFGGTGVGVSQAYVGSNVLHAPFGGSAGVNTRASNSASYFTPGGLNGFHGQLTYYTGNNPPEAANDEDGSGGGVRVGYKAGPLDVAVAASKTKFAPGDVRTVNVGGSYDLGVAKLIAYIDRDRVARASTVKGRGYLIGAHVPVGVGQVRLSYSRYATDATGQPKSEKLALGYVHNLSKRTALYGTYAHLRNDGSAALALNGSTTEASGKSSGVDLGIRHSF